MPDRIGVVHGQQLPCEVLLASRQCPDPVPCTVTSGPDFGLQSMGLVAA